MRFQVQDSTPACPWGFPPWHAPPPPPGWACSYASDKLRFLSGMRSDPLAPAQGIQYPNPVLLGCPVLCTARPFKGTILHQPHRLRALCFRLTVRVPPLSVTLSLRPLYHRAVSTTVPYVVMDTHMLSAVFVRRLILSVSRLLPRQ